MHREKGHSAHHSFTAAARPLSAKHRTDLAVAAATLSRLRTEFFTLHSQYTDPFPEQYTATTASELVQTVGAVAVPQPPEQHE